MIYILYIQGKSNLSFVWFVMRMAGLRVPSFTKVKNFKMPDFVSPTRVCLKFYFV